MRPRNKNSNIMIPTVTAKVIAISTNLANSQRAKGQMMEVIKVNEKLVYRVTQRYLLQSLMRRKIGTKDILRIEEKQ